jgi:protein involved in polysaccharide export with SLBB domain
MPAGRNPPFSVFPLLPVLLASLLAGCGHGPQKLNQDLMADRSFALQQGHIGDCYRVGCPDVIEWEIEGHPGLSGRQQIGADGRIDLGPCGRPRIEGQTLAEVAMTIAEEADVPASLVQARVIEYKSQQVLLFGQVNALQRTVPYRGQETLVDLLQRAGGISKGAAPDDVYVVRSRVADGRQPEVFHIELEQIVEKKDASTNIRLQPFDQVYVGETGEWRLKKCIPPCLQPLYHGLCGLCRCCRRKPAAEPNAPPAHSAPTS